jgi:hypothetical protein
MWLHLARGATQGIAVIALWHFFSLENPAWPCPKILQLLCLASFGKVLQKLAAWGVRNFTETSYVDAQDRLGKFTKGKGRGESGIPRSVGTNHRTLVQSFGSLALRMFPETLEMFANTPPSSAWH